MSIKICLDCGEEIERNPHAGPGEWFYRHVVPAGHPAIRAPRPVASSGSLEQ